MKHFLLFFCIGLFLVSSSCSKEVEEFYGKFSFSLNGDGFAGNKATFGMENGILVITLGESTDRSYGTLRINIDAPKEGDYVLQKFIAPEMEDEEALLNLTIVVGGSGFHGTYVNFSSIGGYGGIVSITEVGENTLKGTFDAEINTGELPDVAAVGTFTAVR